MSTNTRTATFVARKDGNGEGRVYRCVPPMPAHDYGAEDGHGRSDCTGARPCFLTEYVWVSAAHVVFSGPETYIFPCNAEGEVTNWGELPGSFKGDLDHEEALRGAGYEVIA